MKYDRVFHFYVIDIQAVFSENSVGMKFSSSRNEREVGARIYLLTSYFLQGLRNSIRANHLRNKRNWLNPIARKDCAKIC